MKELTEIVNKKYEAGFVTQVESAVFEKGLSENKLRLFLKRIMSLAGYLNSG